MNKFILASLLFLAFPAWSQQEAPTAAAAPAETASSTAGEKSDRKLELSFEDELVKGQTIKPDSNFLTQGKSFNYKKLIRLRENFIPEAQKGRGEFSDK